jgi:hypothetical protein
VVLFLNLVLAVTSCQGDEKGALMKKKGVKKMTLSRETLRDLESSLPQVAAGASNPTACVTVCITVCASVCPRCEPTLPPRCPQ